MTKRTTFITKKHNARTILERKEADILAHLEAHDGKDKLRYLESGLTPVTARIASKNAIAIGIDLALLKNQPKLTKARYLARIRQNIALARKAKTLLALKGDSREAEYVLLSLGASSNQAAQARTQSF